MMLFNNIILNKTLYKESELADSQKDRIKDRNKLTAKKKNYCLVLTLFKALINSFKLQIKFYTLISNTILKKVCLNCIAVIKVVKFICVE